MTATAQQLQPQAWLQYSTNVQQDDTGAGTIVNFATDQNSFPNGLMDKPAASQFRPLRNMQVEFSFNLDIDADGNNIGTESYVTVNGTRVFPATARSNGRGNSLESVTHALPPYILNLNANDLVRVEIREREGGTMSLEQNNEGISWAKMKLLRILP